MLDSGILLINKPVGISSNKVVNIVKHHLGAKKCGHLGTLDLEGAGLLPVTVGKATKLFDYFLNKDKTYETVFVFGIETDTLDTSGEVLKQCECHITRQQVGETIKQMIGKQMQMPPQYSAKKVNGKIAYKEARKGNEIELRPKEIEIYDFKLLGELQENVFKFEISCSSGTYIRSIARDLAYKLSTYGSMQCILRTRCGGFYLKDAYTLEDVENGNFNLIKMEDVFDYENILLEESDASSLLNGQKIFYDKENGTYKLFDKNQFLGLGKVENGVLNFALRLI
ncbi:MAG: tRNA pseudouridine(55) synthase TruB [Candidatus Caccovivens sp.]